ncbi:MAG TPA: sugar ABC transporter permease [Clostridiaceae bacterium]|nr:sugar ABC transporter permease [Clostridiaceae bacterium]
MSKIKRTSEDWAVDIFSYIFLTVFALITLLPPMNIVAKSLSAEWAIISGKVGLLPIGFQLNTFKYVVTNTQFLHSLLLSLSITILGTGLSIIVSGATAYPLSKRHLPGIKVILFLYVFTMFFSGGLIPNYLLLKKLNMLNHLSAVIIPGMINVFNMLIIKNYYETLPDSLEESAKLDGASNIRILFSIIIPLSLPVYATITLFTAVAHWNDYFTPMIYLNDSRLKVLTVYLRDVVMNVSDPSKMSEDELLNVSPEGVKAATIVASTVPILLVYPYLQKYFIKGILIGSVKE